MDLAKEKWINPANGMITSCFGERMNPILNKKEFHKGIDIGVAEGTDVVAVKSGNILEVKTSMTYGNVVKFETVDGYTIVYAHCKEIFAHQGEMIEQGQFIASVGSTGLSTGPHVHYEIWKNGKLVDPILYVHLPLTVEAKMEQAKKK